MSARIACDSLIRSRCGLAGCGLALLCWPVSSDSRDCSRARNRPLQRRVPGNQRRADSQRFPMRLGGLPNGAMPRHSTPLVAWMRGGGWRGPQPVAGTTEQWGPFTG